TPRAAPGSGRRVTAPPSQRSEVPHPHVPVARPGRWRIRLDRLAAADVETFMAGKVKAGLSPRSVHHLRAVLRTALGRAMRWDMVGKNVAALTEPVKVEHHEYHVLDPEQARH